MRVVEIAPCLISRDGKLIIKEVVGRDGPLGCRRGAITEWGGSLGEAMPVLFGLS